MTLQAMLERDEGRENQAYQDSLGLWTCGIGHHDDTINAGTYWDDPKVDQVFADDVAEKTAQCVAAFPWLETLSEARQAVIIAMAFQMGLNRLKLFAHMLAYCAAGDFDAASKEMLNSLWAHQTPKRAARMALQLQTGNWI